MGLLRMRPNRDRALPQNTLDKFPILFYICSLPAALAMAGALGHREQDFHQPVGSRAGKRLPPPIQRDAARSATPKCGLLRTIADFCVPFFAAAGRPAAGKPRPGRHLARSGACVPVAGRRTFREMTTDDDNTTTT